MRASFILVEGPYEALKYIFKSARRHTGQLFLLILFNRTTSFCLHFTKPRLSRMLKCSKFFRETFLSLFFFLLYRLCTQPVINALHFTECSSEQLNGSWIYRIHECAFSYIFIKGNTDGNETDVASKIFVHLMEICVYFDDFCGPTIYTLGIEWEYSVFETR